MGKTNRIRSTREEQENKDVQILKAIYELEIVKRQDIENMGIYETKSNTAHRLYKMLHNGEVEMEYVNEGGRGKNFSVYQITERGIDKLEQAGQIDKRRRARDIRAESYKKPHRVRISAICIELSKHNWKYIGRKDAKQQLGLAPNDRLEAVLISPEGTIYQAYYLNNDAELDRIKLIVKEIQENQHSSLVFYMANGPTEKTPAFKKIMHEIEREKKNVNELCILPYTEIQENGQLQNLAIETLRMSDGHSVRQYLQTQYQFVKEITNRYLFGNHMVSDGQHEYLICNYLRRDIVALRLLSEQLTENEHRQNGYRAIVLTWKGFYNEVMAQLEKVQLDRDFIKVVIVRREELLSHKSTQTNAH